ncbi:sodium:calcium antiporter [Hymenobacter aerilatus]|uniref:Sodium:calcium antiporter n=1 Tax=Hymenobacter aerilatus TaxID=2932251 RepID=A0A8T9T1C9_9BACT|nr:sodium:calcium antiporter [Hymenobacter aerilatus]UOR05809.1 sodium:calcium antiporter [Hymenobacter aerilatus]
MSHFSPALLVALFVVAAVVVWQAGTYLSDTTDVLAQRLKLGDALGGLLLLAIVTNLPEVVITLSASLRGQVDLAVGNILGGIAVQTLVLVGLDAFGKGHATPLTHRVHTLQPVLEALLVVAVLTVVVLGAQLPASLLGGHVSPAEVVLVLLWLGGVFLVGKAEHGLPWLAHAPAATTNRPEPQDATQQKQKPFANSSTKRVALVFGAASLATLLAGWALEVSGEQLADQLGMTGLFFGATVLAAATSLPEVSTGLAALQLGKPELVVSDIFGGNAFLPVLFLLAALVSGKAVLPRAQASDLYLTGLGILLSSVYAVGLVFRSRRQVGRLGLDSWAVLVLYALGMLGLLFIQQ